MDLFFSCLPFPSRFRMKYVVMLIEALSNPEKPRLKEDGTNLSSWLQSNYSLGRLTTGSL